MSTPFLLMNRRPSGGFGNQLFQYNFLFQFSHIHGVEFLHRGFPQLSGFELQKESKIKSLLLGMNAFNISLETINERKWQQTCDEVQQFFQEGKSVNVMPGILGEYYKEVTNIDPKFVFRSNQGKINVQNEHFLAVHYRGKDFHQWNSRAVMSFEFYLKGVQKALKNDSKINQIKIFTDDRESETVSRLVGFFGAEISDGSEEEDFKEMMQTKTIVASPSTFAFWSAALGDCQEIYYSRDWLHYASETGQKFWSDLRKGSLPFFPTVLEV